MLMESTAQILHLFTLKHTKVQYAVITRQKLGNNTWAFVSALQTEFQEKKGFQPLVPSSFTMTTCGKKEGNSEPASRFIYR